MKQQPLEITFRQIPRFRDFLVTDCNKVAAAVVRQWPDWPGPYPVLNLIGPPSSGKSHLAAIWRSHLVECQILDRIKPNDMPPGPPFFVLDGVNDFEKWDEEALFHLFNRCKNEKGGLLILSEKPVSQIPWRLADLRSRFRSVNVVHIDLPDDELLFAS